MQIIVWLNILLGTAFFVCYAYQLFYILVPFIKKEKPCYTQVEQNRYAILISARNEARVIKNLLDSIRTQTYNQKLIDVFVVADNCTDNTADIAESCGAHVYRRFDDVNIGKGYALNYVLNKINGEYGSDYFDGYLVIDADNVLDSHYLEEINATRAKGYDILTSYRNSKNYGDNWISAGYALWFLRETKYLNYSRMLMNTSCAISGTGFMFSKRVFKELNGSWEYYLLTEDIEFTVDHVVHDYKIGIAKDAVLYDEQPNTFAQSVRQRMRWAKGYFQVMCNYGMQLINGTLKKRSFSCFDMTMNIMPAIFLTFFMLTINVTALVTGSLAGMNIMPVLSSLGNCFMGMYGMLFLVGAITVVTEWKNIYTSAIKKILYSFTFPIFMITYVPITIAALFKKVEWKPIVHSEAKTLTEIVNG